MEVNFNFYLHLEPYKLKEVLDELYSIKSRVKEISPSKVEFKVDFRIATGILYRRRNMADIHVYLPNLHLFHSFLELIGHKLPLEEVFSLVIQHEIIDCLLASWFGKDVYHSPLLESIEPWRRIEFRKSRPKR